MVRTSSTSQSHQAHSPVRGAAGRANSALAAVLGAGAATLGAPTDATAAPTLVNQTGSITIDSLGNITSPNPLEFDLDGVPGLNGFPDVQFSAAFGFPSQFDMTAHGVNINGSPPYVSALGFGELIPSTTGGGVTIALGPLTRRLADLADLMTGTGDGHFIGASDPSFASFYFEDANGDFLPAWARVSVEFGSDSATLHIHGFGYQSDHEGSIRAGVPEPGSAALALMAAGAVGVATRRQRQNREE